MAQAGEFLPDSSIDSTLEVYVNGFLREHESVEFAGDTPGGLPDQVVSTGTGMLSRTGRIIWSGPAPMVADAPHPVRRRGGWPPREGDRLEIDAIVNGVRFRRFTGRLGRTTGSLTGYSLESEITDTLSDHLGELVNIPPRLSGNLGQAYRVAWEALEQVGLGLLPRPDEGVGTTILHSTPQGDTWATIGGSVSTSGSTSSTRDVAAGLTLWTNLVTDVLDESRLGNSILAIGRGSTQHSSDLVLDLTDGTEIRLRHDSGTLSGYIDGTLVHQGPYFGTGVPILAFGISFGWLHIWTSDKTKVEILTDSLPSKAAHVTGIRLAAAQVRYIADLDDGGDVVAGAPLQPAALRLPTISNERLPATRGFENVAAKSVVEAWGGSVLASVWQNEFGQTEVQSRAVMLSRPTQRRVDLSERVFGGSWSIGDDGVRSTVVVKGEQGLIQGSLTGNYRVTIHQEQTVRVVTEAEGFERFIEAPPEMDWGPVDLEPSRWTSNASVTGNQPGYGTWIHAVVPFDDPNFGKVDRWAWDNVPNPSTYDATIEALGQRTLKVTETVAPGSGVADGVFLKSPERKEYQLSTWIWSPYRDVPSPVIRARWATTWAPYTRKASAGPAYAPILEHDIDWWLTPADGQALATALAAEVAKPMATLSQTPTLFDPTRQVGDIEEWVAQDVDGNDVWSAKVLVVGYRESWSKHTPTQSVDARVISLTNIEPEVPFTPMWGFAPVLLTDPKGPQMSPWAMDVGELIDPPVIVPSAWGRDRAVLVEPLGMVASPWGRAVVTLVEPHRPVGVWDGTKMSYTEIDVWLG